MIAISPKCGLIPLEDLIDAQRLRDLATIAADTAEQEVREARARFRESRADRRRIYTEEESENAPVYGDVDQARLQAEIEEANARAGLFQKRSARLARRRDAQELQRRLLGVSPSAGALSASDPFLLPNADEITFDAPGGSPAGGLADGLFPLGASWTPPGPPPADFDTNDGDFAFGEDDEDVSDAHGASAVAPRMDQEEGPNLSPVTREELQAARDHLRLTRIGARTSGAEARRAAQEASEARFVTQQARAAARTVAAQANEARASARRAQFGAKEGSADEQQEAYQANLRAQVEVANARAAAARNRQSLFEERQALHVLRGQRSELKRRLLGLPDPAEPGQGGSAVTGYLIPITGCFGPGRSR